MATTRFLRDPGYYINGQLMRRADIEKRVREDFRSQGYDAPDEEINQTVDGIIQRYNDGGNAYGFPPGVNQMDPDAVEEPIPMSSLQGGYTLASGVGEVLTMGPNEETVANYMGGDRKTTFIQKYMPYAQEASALTGVDPSVILAQAAHETGWGKSAPGNNFFGIKGGGQSFATHEYINGKRVNVRAGFRRYDDPRQSFLDWAKLMHKRPYAGVLAAKTPEEQIQALKDAGYATDPAYVSKLKNVRNQVLKVAGDVPVEPVGVGGIMDVATRNQAPSAVPDQKTAAFGYAPDLGGVRGAPAVAAIEEFIDPTSGLPSFPPEWDMATGFPIDEALTGQSAQDVLAGGPRLDPRRVAPAAGPMPADMGSMRSAADVLDAGPRSRPSGFWDRGPGGAPDASAVPTPGISPLRPAVGGPNDRRPTPPTPPSRAQGIPDPRIRPDPASLPQRGFPTAYGEQPGPPGPLSEEDRQRILSDINEFRQRNQYSPMVAGMPDIPRPQFKSRIAGRPEFPGAIQPPSAIPEEPLQRSEPRVPAFSGLTPELMDRLRQSQGVGPFPARPEYPGALPAAPNPYDDPSRQFDVPPFATRMAMIRGEEPQAPGSMPASQEAPLSPESARMFGLPAMNAPASFPGPDPIIGTEAAGSTTGEFFTPAPPMPSAAPDPLAGRFDNAFSPSAPGMIAGLPGAYSQRQAAASPVPAPVASRSVPEPYERFETAVGWMPQFAQPYAVPQPQPTRPDTVSQTLSTLPPQALAQIEARRQEAAQAGLVYVDIDLDSLLSGSQPMPQPVQMASNDPTQMPMGFGPSYFGYGEEPGLSIGATPVPAAAPSMADVGIGAAGGFELAAPEPAQAPSRPQMAAPPPGGGNPSNTGIAAAGTPFGARQGSGGILGMLGIGKNPAQFYTQGSGSSPYGDDQVTQWKRGETNALGGSEGLQWTGSNGNTVTAVQNPWGGGYFTSYS